jgi:hypothetical protein
MKEREDNVKAEVFAAYAQLLRQTRLALPHTAAAFVLDNSGGTNERHMRTVVSSLALNNLTHEEHMVWLRYNLNDNHFKFLQIYDALIAQLPSLMKTLQRQLGERSPRTRYYVFSLFTHIVQVVPNAFAPYMSLLVNGSSVFDTFNPHRLSTIQAFSWH